MKRDPETALSYDDDATLAIETYSAFVDSLAKGCVYVTDVNVVMKKLVWATHYISRGRPVPQCVTDSLSEINFKCNQVLNEGFRRRKTPTFDF